MYHGKKKFFGKETRGRFKQFKHPPIVIAERIISLLNIPQKGMRPLQLFIQRSSPKIKTTHMLWKISRGLIIATSHGHCLWFFARVTFIHKGQTSTQKENSIWDYLQRLDILTCCKRTVVGSAYQLSPKQNIIFRTTADSLGGHNLQTTVLKRKWSNSNLVW